MYSWSFWTREGMGFGTDFKIGAGPSRQVLVYYSNRVLWYKPNGTTGTRVNGLSSVGVTYFRERTAPSFFFSGAVGVGGLADGNLNSLGTGPGLTAGVGYEFFGNFVAEITATGVHLGSERQGNLYSTSLMLTVSWLAY